MAEKIIAVRIHPGSDLKAEIEGLVEHHKIRAGWIITCVGSLSRYCLRFANQKVGTYGQGHFEILSLAGTLSPDGCHLHLCIADETGESIGGHVLGGCIVYTTAELILASTDELSFERQTDNITGSKELIIKTSKK